MITRQTLLGSLAIAALAASASGQLLTDFEGYTVGSAVMFRQPTFSGSTSTFLDAAPTLAYTTNIFPGGNAAAGLSVYYSSWSFKTPDNTGAWLRLTTSGTANVGNPIVSFTDGLKFDIYSDRALYVSLGLRETNPTGAIGANGGSSGTIEFVGGTPTTTASAVTGRLVQANTWTTLLFDMPAEQVRGFTGNGILESTTGKGVLENLTIVPADVANSGVYNIYLDNFQVIPEPSSLVLSLAGGLGFLAVLLRRRMS